ncbi:sensor histidine kinase [Massilia sp. TS11]|uniref:sensor histidine kinase n=1 Tax=Massilia sp. TS11 TaxID=2908003 RepID=UPI001EDB094D|nr:sensor histidine kinase [Massilia sp. TS11]MCG2584747.1 HAMP domain-containing histidine kinase [Massilia sp. TS11]
MSSLIPALVSLLFLSFGIYVLVSRGTNRVSIAFFLLCLATFSWQFCWSVLFQVQSPALAAEVARIGYGLILFLPTSLYLLVVELTRRQQEMVWVKLSACIALALALSDQVVDGVYHYSFGFYPRAGLLHPVHLVQTVTIIVRSAWLLYHQQACAASVEQLRLRYCLASIATYGLAAIDYACNYGLAIYPPGVMFIVLSLGMMAQAIARHQLMANPLQLAATVVHEMRTPLATIRGQARVLAKGLPELIAGYELATANGQRQAQLQPAHLAYLRELASDIEAEVSRTDFIADSVLASARDGSFSRDGFGMVSMSACIDEALKHYPFGQQERARLHRGEMDDFRFVGSARLMVLVLYNLIKNALQAGGEVCIVSQRHGSVNLLSVTDSGHGIPEHILPHVFDPYFTTRAAGTGMGLPFCRRAMLAFGGSIEADSAPNSGTVFTLRFPAC